jgi:trehalose 6-phosphate phosphatase
MIGNHGIEPWHTSLGVARGVDAWIPTLNLGLRNFAKLLVENKKFSISIHYRRERNKKKALRAIMKLARTLPNARLVGGKQVVNIVPFGAPNKGFAVEQARRRLGCDKVIYVGDDETDEDAFVLSRDRRFLAVRVGANRSSLARFYLRNQREIDPFLRILVARRKIAPAG